MTARENYLIKLIQSQNVALSILKGLVPESAQAQIDETIRMSNQGIEIIRKDDHHFNIEKTTGQRTADAFYGDNQEHLKG